MTGTNEWVVFMYSSSSLIRRYTNRDSDYLEPYVPAFGATKRTFWVAPSTHTWNAFSCRADLAVSNALQAASLARLHGATGYLMTDWGDNGHHQPLLAADWGIAAGAVASWETTHANEAILHTLLPRAIDGFLRFDASGALGHIQRDLGLAHCLSFQFPGLSLLFHTVVHSHRDGPHYIVGTLPEQWVAVCDHVRETSERISEMSLPESREGAVVLREVRWLASVLLIGSKIGLALAAHASRFTDALNTEFGLALEVGDHDMEVPGDWHVASLPAPVREKLLHDLTAVTDEYADLWSERARGTPDASLARFHGVKDALARGRASK
jgi:hypothetical protein